MLTEHTIDKMNAMKLYAFAEAFSQQLASAEFSELSFEERTGLLVDAEYTARENRKLSRRLSAAKLRYPASIENIDYKTPRKLDRQQLLSLATCAWLVEHHNLIITGPTGIGKSFLACAFVERACRRRFNAYYVRAPRLIHDLAVSRIDGSYSRVLPGTHPPRQTRPPCYRRLAHQSAQRHRAPRPHGGHRGTRRAWLYSHLLPAPYQRMARLHRRPQSCRRPV